MKKPACQGWPLLSFRAQFESSDRECTSWIRPNFQNTLTNVTVTSFHSATRWTSRLESFLLASLTFLALQSTSIITSPTPLPRPQLIAQMVAIGFMVLSGIFSVIELWPRDYMREAMPEDYETWMSSLDHYRKQYPDADSPTLPTARLSLAKQRIKINSDINNLKSKTMFVAFYSLVGAFIANLTNASYAPFLNGTLGGDCGGAGAGFGSPCQAPAPPGPEWSNGRSADPRKWPTCSSRLTIAASSP